MRMRIPKQPPGWADVFSTIEGFAAINTDQMKAFVQKANHEYLHWDKLRYQEMPAGVSNHLAWAAVELSRSTQRRALPLTFTTDSKLSYWTPPRHLEWISFVDRKASGVLGLRDSFPDDDERYVFSSLMEEAIASSQIEGASTTRNVAKEMLRTNRKPQTQAERMILNNYTAMLEIRETRSERLTPQLLLHLQDVLTEGTLDDTPDAGARFRREDEDIQVVDNVTKEPLHIPPPASQIEKRLNEICEFANTKTEPFVHPIIKAMALHFAIGYVHPFVDGNGRTARALFYWQMLKSGYWLFEYLPISRIILKSPVRYGTAYLHTETDGGDLTYFNHYQLNVIQKAIHDLLKYLAEQRTIRDEANAILRDFPALNLRQRLVIQDALKRPSQARTIREHEGEYHVSYNTARADLLGLEQAGLLTKKKDRGGKEWIFAPPSNLVALLKKSRRQPKKKRDQRAGKRRGSRSLFDLLDD
jgi:Fic family protein